MLFSLQWLILEQLIVCYKLFNWTAHLKLYNSKVDIIIYMYVSHQHSDFFGKFSPFCSLVKQKESMKMKKTHCIAQWINLNWNVSITPDFILPPLVAMGPTADRLADKIQVNFENFKILCRLTCSDFTSSVQCCYSVSIAFCSAFLK